MKKYSFKRLFLVAVLVLSLVLAACGKVSYTVTFNTDGGSDVASQSVRDGSSAVRPTLDPTKTGYTFYEWYEESAKTTPFNFGKAITSNTTVYAKWVAITYTVRYNKNGGDGTMDDTGFSYDEEKALRSNSFTMEGYDFTGWNTVADGSGTAYTDGQTVKNLLSAAGEFVLYAQWEDNGEVEPEDPPFEPSDDGRMEGVYVGEGEYGSMLFRFTATLDGAGEGIIVVEVSDDEGENWVNFADSMDGMPQELPLIYAVEDDSIKINCALLAEIDPDLEIFTCSIDTDGNILGVQIWELTIDLIKYVETVTYTATFMNGSTSFHTQTVDENGFAEAPETDPVKTGYTFDGWFEDGEDDAFDFETPITANLILEARWSANNYIVKYNGNSGTGTMSDSSRAYDDGESVRANTFTKTGYTFTGWKSGDAVTGAAVAAGAVANLSENDGDEITLYAQWRSNTYTVKYDGNSGTGAMSDSSRVYDDGVAVKANTFSKANYTFTGWRLGNAATGDIIAADSTANLTATDGATVTLYAQWNENAKFTVSFNVDSGSAVASQEIYIGGKVTRPSNPTKTGYTFDEWYIDDAGSALFDFANTTVSATTTIYAKWTANTYTVIYNANGGAGETASVAHTYNVSKNLTSVTALGFHKDGYNFVGWGITADAEEPLFMDEAALLNYTSVNNDTVTFYAIWLEETLHMVMFNVDGGSAVASMQIPDGNNVTRPSDPTKTGYTFAGWYADSAKTAEFNFESTVISEATTIYAKWTANNYTVKYDGNGGVGTMSDDSRVYGDGLTVSVNTFTRAGYTFTGWKLGNPATGASVAADSTANLAEDNGVSITLYAQWRLNAYTVKYNSNGGDGTMSDDSREYNDGSALTANTFSRTGYIFSGWNTDSDGSGSDYAEGFTGNLAQNDGITVNLYAQWTAIGYTFSFDINLNGNGKNGSEAEGSVAMTGGSRTYDDGALIAANTFARVGYRFNGWNTAADGSGVSFDNESDLNLTAESGASVVLYAQWLANVYTINYNRNGASGSYNATITASYDVSYNLAATGSSTSGSAPSGYSVSGWNLLPGYNQGILSPGTHFASGASVINLTATNGATVTIYAEWTGTSRTLTFNSGGGSGGNPTRSYNNGLTVTLPTLETLGISRPGYTFLGWGTSSSGSTVNVNAETYTMGNSNTTIYAKWQMNVTFDSAGGSAVTGQAVIIGDKAVPPNSPTRTGYTFACWFLGDDTTAFDFDNSVIEAAIVLTAKWNANAYEVSFNSNNADSGTMENQAFIYDAEGQALTLNVYVRAGFTFVGWNTSADGLGISYGDGAEVRNLTADANGVFVLYAQWIIENYTVQYDANGGEGTMAADLRTFNDGNSLTENDFTKTGYRFNGWNTESDGNGLAYADEFRGDIMTDVPSVTLYAQWLANTYTVSYNRNGASGTTSNTTLTYDRSGTLASTSVNRSGFVFVGLCLDSAGNGTIYALGATVLNLTEEHGITLTMYYIWARAVTLNVNGGSGSNTVINVVMNGNATSADWELPQCTFTRNGYIFDGWGTTAAGGTVRQPGETVNISGATSFFVQWKATLTFNTNGGSAVPVPEFDEGDKIERPAIIPTKDGYVFDNWYMDEELTVLFDFASEEIMFGTVIYAGWTANTYTVEYDSNGGVGNMDPSSHIFDSATALRVNDFSKDGAQFIGWNTGADGRGTSYANGAIVNIVTNPGETVVLYAQWFGDETFGSYTAGLNVNIYNNNNDAREKTGEVVMGSPEADDVLWNGKKFEGVFAAKTRILISDSIVQIYFNGKCGENRVGGGWWMVGANSGTISYTISGNSLSLLVLNTSSNATDQGTFTISNDGNTISGSMAGASATAHRYDNITGLTINSDGTGTVNRSTSSVAKISGDREITWTINSDGKLVITEGAAVIGTFDPITLQLTYNCYDTNGQRILNIDVTVQLIKNIP